MNGKTAMIIVLLLIILCGCQKKIEINSYDIPSKTICVEVDKNLNKYAILEPSINSDKKISFHNISQFIDKGIYMLEEPTEEMLELLSSLEYVNLYMDIKNNVFVEISNKANS